MFGNRSGKSAMVRHYLNQIFELTDSTVGIEAFNVQVTLCLAVLCLAFLSPPSFPLIIFVVSIPST